MFGLIKKVFAIFLTSIINAFNHTKFVSLSNQQCTTQLTPISLHPNAYTQGLCYYSLAVRCTGNCNTLNDLSNKACVLHKTGNLNLNFKMITRINNSKILTKYVSCKYKCEFDSRKCNSNQTWNNDKCRCGYKKSDKKDICAKKIFGILLNVLMKIVDMQEVLLIIQ